MSVWLRGWLLFLGAGFCAAVPIAGAGDAAVETTPEIVPSFFYTRPGQFEIVVADARDAGQLIALGQSVWSALEGPVGLPADGFNSPVTVRMVPSEMWNSQAPFIVSVEPPGLVAVRVRWAADVDPVFVRRAFVQGVILRQAVSFHGVGRMLTVPLWLEHACTLLSLVRDRPSMLDSFQQQSLGIVTVPSLRDLINWERGGLEPRSWELSALWLLMQLQTESSDGARWGVWLRGVFGGAEPMDTLPQVYTGLWADWGAMELWWKTGFYNQSRQRFLPAMTAEASRIWLENRSRWLAARNGAEVVLQPGELIGWRKEPWVMSELRGRLRQTQSIIGMMHPFFANATLSLGRIYEASAKGDKSMLKNALADFERDVVDGRELEDTVGAILDTAPRE